MQAMPDTKAAERGLSYLRKAQRPSGGFVTGGNGAVNSQSTAWAVQGMIAVGAKADSVRTDGNSPSTTSSARQDERRPLPLLVLQRPDPGLGDRPGPGRRLRQVLPPRPTRPNPQASPAKSTTSRTGDHRQGSRPGGSCFHVRTLGRLPTSHAAGGVAAPPERFAAPGSPTPEATAPPASAGGREREGSNTAPPATLASESSTDDAGSMTTRAAPPAPLAIGFGLGAAIFGGSLVAAPSLRLRLVGRRAAYTLARWTSRPRSAPAAPTRRSAPSRSPARSSRSCSSSPAGRPTTT